MTNRSKPLTPIEKLLADKIDLEAKCRIQEKKLNDDLEYIQEHASGILISGLSSLFFSSAHTGNKPEKQFVALSGKNRQSRQSQDNNFLSVANMFVVAKSIAPVAWEIIQSLLIKWGISKVKSLLLELFTPKDKAPTKNQ